MTYYLKKYNKKLIPVSNEMSNMSEEQIGDGVLTDLIFKGLSHLLPSLISKFGEKSGEYVGNIVTKMVQDKLIKTPLPDSSMPSATQSGGANLKNNMDKPQFIHINGNEYGNKSFVSSYDKINSGIQPVITSHISSDTNLAGTGTNLAGTRGRGRGRPRGRGTNLAGVNFRGKGVIQMTGSGYTCNIDDINLEKGSGFKLAGDIISKELKTFSNNIKKQQKGSGYKSLKPKEIKNKLNEVYNHYLLKIMDKIGCNETMSSDLDTIGKHFFKSKWGGVLAADQLPNKPTKKFYIVNCDTSGMPGSHWLGMVNNYVYDSFGRNKNELSKFFSANIGKNMIKACVNKNLNREQSFNEENCGQRSLAWLMTYYTNPDVVKYL